MGKRPEGQYGDNHQAPVRVISRHSRAHTGGARGVGVYTHFGGQLHENVAVTDVQAVAEVHGNSRRDDHQPEERDDEE